MAISDVQQALREFAAQRDWEQFHTPKNLVMALAAEVGELVDIFQWLTPDESMTVLSEAGRAEHVRDEIADVFGYLLRLCDVLGVDRESAIFDKIIKNAVKYPPESSKGSAAKYTDLL
jgi:dCTP diphosphatase